MNVSDWIALGSLLVAIIALAKSFLSDRKIKNMDLAIKEYGLEAKQKEEEEQKKADVEVNVVETAGANKTNLLRFYNRGRATATNINFEIVSDKEDFIELIIENDYLPYPQLLPQQNFDVHYFNQGNRPHERIKISWDDPSGKNRSKEMVVDMN